MSIVLDGIIFLCPFDIVVLIVLFPNVNLLRNMT